MSYASTRKRRDTSEADDGLLDIAAQLTDPMNGKQLLWALRMLVPMGGYRKFVEQDGFASTLAAKTLGLMPNSTLAPEAFDRSKIICDLNEMYQRVEADPASHQSDPVIAANIASLGSLIGLNAVERLVVEFAVALDRNFVLQEIESFLGRLVKKQTYNVIATIIGVSPDATRKAMSQGGMLRKSGIIDLSDRYESLLSSKLEFMSRSFAEFMTNEVGDPIEFLRDSIRRSSPGHLEWSDYRHIQPTLDVLRPYLHAAIAQKRKGVNILIHGAPGLGKTQLVKLLASDYPGCELIEVSCEDDEGDPLEGNRRLRSLRVAQSILARRTAIILFDEIEAIFEDGSSIFSGSGKARKNKAWINNMLETNALPVLWLSNSIQSIDPANIRRFDMVIEMKVPPRTQRAAIIRNACGSLLDEDTVLRLSEHRSISPATVDRTAKVIATIQDQLQPNQANKAFELLIDGTLRAQGHPSLRQAARHRLPSDYDPQFINADVDLSGVIDWLRNTGSGRIYISGPSGTGKSAYAHWIAQQLDVPIIIKRASDILSKWVGETERGIASAFEEAEEEGAVLVIDEVDTFLTDRRRASHQWEASLVNEMLTQIENYRGILVFTTNLPEAIDAAALRRFDLKAKFDYLTSEQAWTLLCKTAERLGMEAPSDDDQIGIGKLSLTPSDFVHVADRYRRVQNLTQVSILSALQILEIQS